MADDKAELREVLERLMAQEFLIEVGFANWLATTPAESAEAYVAKLVEVAGRAYGPITGDPEEARRNRQSAANLQGHVGQIAGKALRRALEIRQIRQQDPSRRPRD